MLRIVSNIQRLAEETPDSFGRRSARLVSDIQITQTRWPQIWAQNVIMWSAHVLRNTNDMSWPAQVLSVQSSTSLRELRAFNGSRPGTRASSGFLPTRWTDGLSNAIQFVKPLNRKIRQSIEEACGNFFQVDMQEMLDEHLIASFLSFF